MTAHASPFLEFWRISERPFEPVGQAKFYYESGEHKEALARLHYLVDQETMYFGMLTGEIGCGKSLTRQVFASRLNPQQHCLVQFENSIFPTSDLLRRLFDQVGWTDHAQKSVTAYSLYVLMGYLLQKLSEDHDRQLVLLFDEAQDMSPDTMMDLKRLSNLNDEGTGRLSIILIGQPELRQAVKELPSLDQRITLRYHLNPLGQADIGSYLRHRLVQAGHPHGELFTESAQKRLYEASGGFPREINRLAKLAMEEACNEANRDVSDRHVNRVIEDLRRHQSMPVLRNISL